MRYSVETRQAGSNRLVELIDRPTNTVARLLPGYGFNLYSIDTSIGGRAVDLLFAPPDFGEHPREPTHFGIPVLFPFANRIAAGRFEFAGKTYELERNEKGINASHGFATSRPWRVIASDAADESGSRVAGQFRLTVDAPDAAPRWPADAELQIEYRLVANAVWATVEIRNPDTRPLPCSFGTHPYFRLPLAPESDPSQCLVEVPAHRFWELDHFLPTGSTAGVDPRRDLRHGRALADLELDDVLTGLDFGADGFCTSRLIDHPAGIEVRLRFDRTFHELVVFTPRSRRAICLEPYTSTTDAFNLEPRGIDAGLLVLSPGEQVRGQFVIEWAAR